MKRNFASIDVIWENFTTQKSIRYAKALFPLLAY